MPFAAGNVPPENDPATAPIAHIPKPGPRAHMEHPMTLDEFNDDYEADGRHPHPAAT